ncbi:hypothetical protein BB561_000888 [Smittium simulii]|uniref:Uncharacterized protein n=1 Tax=Smittium simulii TaxID=133385 RepID=A0A2T9YX32_9FUNG|nr:hypothetical protein BB561_000888 [Smittium simulii]
MKTIISIIFTVLAAVAVAVSSASILENTYKQNLKTIDIFKKEHITVQRDEEKLEQLLSPFGFLNDEISNKTRYLNKIRDESFGCLGQYYLMNPMGFKSGRGALYHIAEKVKIGIEDRDTLLRMIVASRSAEASFNLCIDTVLIDYYKYVYQTKTVDMDIYNKINEYRDNVANNIQKIRILENYVGKNFHDEAPEFVRDYLVLTPDN